MGKVQAICVSDSKGRRKQSVPDARFIAGHGIEGDAHAGHWHRQISLLAAGDIEQMRSKGLADATPGIFGENMVLADIDLSDLGLGSRLKIGPGVELSITQIGKQCHAPCSIYDQTGECIMPDRGLFARVLEGGRVTAGQAVSVSEQVPRATFQVVVLTVSDRCHRGTARDTAGPAVAAVVEDALQAHIYRTHIVPDKKNAITEQLKHYCDGHSIDLVITVGGTGFAPRDVTPEAVAEVIERPTPGLDEAMRRASLEKTPHAILSRSVSGIRGSALIISLPGSERAAVENITVITPALTHGLNKLRGDPTDCGYAGKTEE